MTPYVGREEELDLLHNAYARAVRDRRTQLVTIFGEPGIGKSRLVREFFAGLERTTVLTGRSLPFGEGLAYRPLAEMVQAAAGISPDDSPEEAFEKLREACSSDAVADLLGLASGVLDTVSGSRRGQEIAWAAQEWATSLAEAQPLVLGFEDVHWAEEPLLDLIEHLADRVDDAPVLVVCLARPELLETRPGWGGGRRRSITIDLGPLPEAETEQLVDALVAGAALPHGVRGALLDKTEGNPLFVEETIRMLAEQGDAAAVRIPDTVQALIASRIDRLPPASRSVVRHGALVGRVFWRGALAELDPELDVDAALVDLVERQLLTREPISTIPGELAFRFRHVLIRDVAYSGLAKGQRARLHRTFAGWLRSRSADELVEAQAYHLDRAAALLAELDGQVPAEPDRGCGRAGAGRAPRARAGGQPHSTSAAAALDRARAEPRAEVPRRPRGLAALGAPGGIGRDGGGAGPRPRGGGAHVRGAGAHPDRRDRPEPARRRADRAPPRPRGARPARRSPRRRPLRGAHAPLDHRLVGRGPDERRAVRGRDTRACARCRARRPGEPRAHRARRRGACPARHLHGGAAPRGRRGARRRQRQPVRACLGCARPGVDPPAPRALHRGGGGLRTAYELFDETGAAPDSARARQLEGVAVWRAGDVDRAEQLVREAVRTLLSVQERGKIVEAQRTLAEIVLAQGHVEEAERWALSAVETVGMQDMMSRSNVRMVLGLVRAAQGRDAEAELLLREALDVLAETDYRNGEPEPSRRSRSSCGSMGARTRRASSKSASPPCFSPSAQRGSSRRGFRPR